MCKTPIGIKQYGIMFYSYIYIIIYIYVYSKYIFKQIYAIDYRLIMWLYINGSTWLLISRTRVIQSLAWFHRKKKDIMTWQTPPNPYIPPANSRRPCLNCQFSVKSAKSCNPLFGGVYVNFLEMPTPNQWTSGLLMAVDHWGIPGVN
jgi:hypothetical protein